MAVGRPDSAAPTAMSIATVTVSASSSPVLRLTTALPMAPPPHGREGHARGGRVSGRGVGSPSSAAGAVSVGSPRSPRYVHRPGGPVARLHHPSAWEHDRG